MGTMGACGGAPATPQPTSPALRASPVVLGGDNGLEVQYWVAAGGPGEMWAAFDEFAATPPPLDESVVAMLRDNGLRVLAVPVDRLPEVQARLSIIGAVQRQWLGQAPGWVDAAAGPQRDAGQTIHLHDGPLRLSPGRLRLLLRGWTLPAPAPSEGGRGAAIHVEVVPQHQETRPAGAGTLGEALRPEPKAPEDEGVLFTRMALSARLSGDVALMFVPETPGVEWKEPPPPQPSEPAEEPPPAAPALGQVSRVDRTAPAPAPQPPPPARAPDAAEAGPPGAALPSLGEAMLMSRGESRTLRAVVVLVPRVPERFDLLGR